MNDYYQILGISKNATVDEIKKAYRKLASQHHPDKGGDKEKFQEIQEAYNILSDPQKRSAYDNPQPQGFGHFEGAPHGFHDIFSQMFGGGGPFHDFFSQGRHHAPRNQNLNIQTTISLEEAFNGKTLIANLKLPSGREQTIEIRIPPGVQDNTTLRLSGMGDDSNPNARRGDIYLTVNISQHPKFVRKDDDLLGNVEINAIEAMLGKKIRVDTIEGKVLEINIEPGTQPGQVLSVPGYGMPNMRDNRFRGRMLLNINIKIPTVLTDQQKELLQKFFQ